MNLFPQIIKHMKHYNDLINRRNIINKKASVLKHCIDTLRYIQNLQDENRLKFKDEHRLLKTGGRDG